MRTPEGWQKAWRKNSALFQNDANMIKHSPTTARSSASLRSSPLYVGLRCVASLRRSGLNFLFYATPGFRGFAAPPPGYFIAPLRGSNLGSLTLAKIPPPSPLQLPIYRSEQIAHGTTLRATLGLTGGDGVGTMQKVREEDSFLPHTAHEQPKTSKRREKSA